VGWIDLAQERQFAGACEGGAVTAGLVKCGGTSWLADEMLGSEEGLCTMGLVG